MLGQLYVRMVLGERFVFQVIAGWFCLIPTVTQAAVTDAQWRLCDDLSRQVFTCQRRLI